MKGHMILAAIILTAMSVTFGMIAFSASASESGHWIGPHILFLLSLTGTLVAVIRLVLANAQQRLLEYGEQISTDSRYEQTVDREEP